ncbi:MAG: SRPBCC family protein [Myxococcales bacterium]|nr:SRPBCC family protein [Myxococcales bacterium]
MRWLKQIGLGVLGVTALLAVAYPLGLRRWQMTWGATAEEVSMPLAGDDAIAAPQRQTTRAITIGVPPEQVFPWVAQLGAGRAAFYSYDWLEQLIGCPLTNGERVTPEWQVRVGDVVRMCPEGKGPPFAYVVKALTPPTALVLAVEDEGRPATTWAFALLPREGGTRLVVRNRTAVEQGWQEVIEPGVMMMERGMLRGLKARAERSVR